MTALAVVCEQPLSFAEGLSLQESLHAARLRDLIPDVVIFLEHLPVITLGRRGRDKHLLVSPEELRRRGVDLAVASRGGDITYHGPGQLVMYPILRLGDREQDAHGYLHNLEEIAIRTAADFGVRAFRREGKNGAWTEAGKLAAIGFHVKRWVTLHGMSFNVTSDLRGFELIVGCGLVGEAVASLESILGASCPTLGAVRERMAANFSAICGRPLAVQRWADALPADPVGLLSG
jgi:lipoyl(octanoyl) transferase